MQIALDVDGVLADCASVVHSEAQRILRRGDLPPPSHWYSFDFAQSMDLTDDQWRRVELGLRLDDALGWQIQLYPDSKWLVSGLEDAGHDVYFLTAQWTGLPHWVTAREVLLKRHFPDTDVVFTHAKHRASFDLLIEDRAQTAVKIGKDRCILLERPWNIQNRPAGFRVATGVAGLLDIVAEHATSVAV